MDRNIIAFPAIVELHKETVINSFGHTEEEVTVHGPYNSKGTTSVAHDCPLLADTRNRMRRGFRADGISGFGKYYGFSKEACAVCPLSGEQCTNSKLFNELQRQYFVQTLRAMIRHFEVIPHEDNS